MKKIYNKLVRDRIPEIIEKDGKTCSTRICSDEEYVLFLKQKLCEEANEVLESKSKEECIKELADVQEVMDALRNVLNISKEEVTAIQVKKGVSNGRFEKKIFLIDVEDYHE